MNRQTLSRAIAVAALTIMPQVSFAEVTLAPRHVMIVRPMIDQVWGSYIFALENRGTAPERFASTLMLPKETVDFRPEEGVTPQEVRLGENGGIVLEKNVDPGTNLVLMAFAVKSLFGKTQLTLKPTVAINDLSILTPPGSLTVTANGAEFTQNVDFSGHPFDRLAIPSIGANQEFVVTIEGIPQGRAALWIAGSLVGAVLAAAALALAWKTRPKLAEAS